MLAGRGGTLVLLSSRGDYGYDPGERLIRSLGQAEHALDQLVDQLLAERGLARPTV